jgi:apolipoprotein D and lipocalin family protein
MSTRKWFLLGALIASAVSALAARNPPLETVSRLDLGRHAGRWYEIARYPNWFEKQCARDITSTYSLRDDGKIAIQNSCFTQDGRHKEANGWARVADKNSNAKLRVTFFWPFFGDYWVLDLGQHYDYAVVGEPSREYLWIMSRTPHMTDEQFRNIKGRLAAKGYDSTKLIRVPQTAH